MYSRTSSVPLAIGILIVLMGQWIAAQAAGPFTPKDPTPEEAALMELLANQRVSLCFEQTGMPDAVAFLANTLKINLAFAGEKVQKRMVSLEVKDISAEAAMRLLVGPEGSYAVIGNCLCLGEASDVEKVFRKEAIIPENPKKFEIALYGALKEKRASVSFVDTPFPDVVQFLRTLGECNLVADENAIKDRIVTMELKQATFDTILRILCGPDLNYGIGQEVIYISTDEGVKKMVEAK